MLKEIIDVYSGNRMKHTNTVCWKCALFIFNRVGNHFSLKDVSGKGCRSCDPAAYIFFRNPTHI
jgi:hypothetical protein